jgi:GT2 family glycosyltransferase
VDCSYRLFAAGYRLVYVPQAVIYHRNERTPWGLVHEGYVHAVHAPVVQALHRDWLREVRRRRPADAPAMPPGVEPSQPHWSDALWWRLFHLGKRLGRAHAAWRTR